jgi:hypothetical protein
MAYRRKSPRRAPRTDELQLLARLLDGPRPLSGGPVGRCLKRGWCQIVRPAQINGAGQESAHAILSGPVLYRLTAKGARELVDRKTEEAANAF